MSLKAGGLSAQTDSARGSNQGGLFIFFSRLLLALKIFYHECPENDIYIILLCACGHFQMNRKVSSTVTCAAILLACALTFAAAQCEFHESDLLISCGNILVVVLLYSDLTESSKMYFFLRCHVSPCPKVAPGLMIMKESSC